MAYDALDTLEVRKCLDLARAMSTLFGRDPAGDVVARKVFDRHRFPVMVTNPCIDVTEISLPQKRKRATTPDVGAVQVYKNVV